MYRDYKLLINTMANGNVNVPDSIKLAYRYKNTYTDLATVMVYGFKHGQTTPEILAYGIELPDSTCSVETHMVHLIKLKKATGILDFFVRINHRESIRDLWNIIGVHKGQAIPPGEQADEGDFSCGLRLLTFDINDGDVFTWEAVVDLGYTYSGTPTHWRVADNLLMTGSTWTAISTNPTYQLENVGPTRLYFQLKNATEYSTILSAEIGWHGSVWVFVDDESITIELPTITDSVSESNPTIEDVPVPESISLSYPTITDSYLDDIP